MSETSLPVPEEVEIPDGADTGDVADADTADAPAETTPEDDDQA